MSGATAAPQMPSIDITSFEPFSLTPAQRASKRPPGEREEHFQSEVATYSSPSPQHRTSGDKTRERPHLQRASKRLPGEREENFQSEVPTQWPYLNGENTAADMQFPIATAQDLRVHAMNECV